MSSLLLGPIQTKIMRLIEEHGQSRAYGNALTEDISAALGREISDGQIYIALSRLERRGFLSSHTELRTTVGRARRLYALTEDGRSALRRSESLFAAAET